MYPGLVSNSRADSTLKEKGRSRFGSPARSSRLLSLKQLPELIEWKQVIKLRYGVCVSGETLTALVQTESTIRV